MKTVWFLFPLLILAGCDRSLSSEGSGEPASITETTATCSEDPGVLLEKPEKITLTAKPTQLSGSLQPGNDVAYSFDGKKGQTLSYSASSDTVCTVVYAWNLETFSASDLVLPADGEYTIQLSSIAGDQPFEISMGLSPNIAVASPREPTDSPPPTSAKAKEQGSLQEADAAKVVQSWLDTKPKIFAPPFDLELVKNIAVSNGPLYQRTAGPSGSVQWLKDEGYYYTYRKSTISQILSYESVANSQFAIKVEIVEDLSLHSPKGIDRSKSGRSSGIYEYILGKEEDTWKIYNSAESK